MEVFCDKLNQSSWRGIVTEVGIGLEFSSRYLRVPGASKTISGVNCPYDDQTRPHDMRAVSLENAKRLAEQNLFQARKEGQPYEHLDKFGLAITGAHYPDRASNVWVYVATPRWNAYMHFEVAANPSRELVGKIVSDRVQWLLEGCMFSTDTWRQHIEEISDSLETHNLDVLYAPGVSDVERLLLFRPDNPLAFHMGRFQRVTDVVRLFPMVYPGAFNPPTKEHLKATALFEISQQHYYKGGLSIEDMIHRMRMLDLEGKPVLLTQAPRFIDKYALLKRYSPSERFIFLLGVDAWNFTIPHHQYPSERWLHEQMPDVEFWIKPRVGIELYENCVSKHLTYKLLEGEGSNANSTAVRESDRPSEHEYLTTKVAEYIMRQGLYKNG
jgi:nicotinic acid mononucleotide adenylyltransferase